MIIIIPSFDSIVQSGHVAVRHGIDVDPWDLQQQFRQSSMLV